jgi:type IV pilus assembly protein PilV
MNAGRTMHTLPSLQPAPVRHSRAAQRGVSMLELLVSLLIFTFGMLGLAGLQTRTLSFNQSSLLRSQATALTDDILDRMRSDRARALAGNWDTALNVAASAMATGTFPERDVRAWKEQVQSLLPAGQASIVTVLPGAGVAADLVGTVTITIQWDDTRHAGNKPTETYTATSLPTATKL